MIKLFGFKWLLKLKNYFYKLINNYLKVKGFERDFEQFLLLSGASHRFSLEWNNRYPCLDDKTSTTGFDRHYLYHPSWAARVLSQTQPKLHVDISSTLHFSAIVSAFIPVQFYDFRPADVKLANLESKAADLLSLPFADNSIDSLSCMHVVEHIGLGRYGDPLDSDGDLKAMAELNRVVAINGNLLFVVPVGKPKIQFNAHRVYSYEQIISYFSEMNLIEFALISEYPSDGGLIFNATAEDVAKQEYGCGCFWFKKEDY